MTDGNPETEAMEAPLEATTSEGVAVSVVLSVYNGADDVDRALECFRRQTFEDFEVIIVDDASTDQTQNVVLNAIHGDDRFRYLQLRENVGAGGARNEGLALARGKYVAFPDHDDLFASTYLELLYERALASSCDVVVCGYRGVRKSDGRMVPLHGSLLPRKLAGRASVSPSELGDQLFAFTNSAAWNKLFRVQFIREHEIGFARIPTAQDMVFTVAALSRAKVIGLVDEELVEYVVDRSGSATNSVSSAGANLGAAFHEIESSLADVLQRGEVSAAFERMAVAVAFGSLLTRTSRSDFDEFHSWVRNAKFERVRLRRVRGRTYPLWLRIAAPIAPICPKFLLWRVLRAIAFVRGARE